MNNFNSNPNAYSDLDLDLDSCIDDVLTCLNLNSD